VSSGTNGDTTTGATTIDLRSNRSEAQIWGRKRIDNVIYRLRKLNPDDFVITYAEATFDKWINDSVSVIDMYNFFTLLRVYIQLFYINRTNQSSHYFFFYSSVKDNF
jgi:hypothetical protein